MPTPNDAGWRATIPADPALDQWWTVATERRVLVVATTVTSLLRLLALLPVVEHDLRIQVVFTRDVESPTVLSGGAAEAVAAVRGVEITWQQAQDLRWDLILTASETDRVHLLAGPCVLVSHGAGYNKIDMVHRSVAGFGRVRLINQGTVVHAAIGLSHPAQRSILAASCPEASDRAQVIGDPSLDVMLENRHRRLRYRDELGIGDRRLVVLTSTFGSASLLGHQPDLPQRVVAALDPDRYVCVVLTHPAITAVHGQQQLRTWLAPAEELGMITLAAGQRWEPILLSADCALVDQGSIGVYATALDLPLITAGGHPSLILENTVVAELAKRAPSLSLDHDIQDQVDTAITSHQPGEYADLAERAFDGPGSFAARMRALCYRLMNLAEPDTPAELGLLDVPVVSLSRPAAFTAAVGGGLLDVEVHRRAATAGSCEWPAGADPHLLVDAVDGPVALLRRADVVYSDHPARRSPGQIHDWAAAVFRTWPAAQMAALVVDTTRCQVIARDATSCELLIEADRGQDGRAPNALTAASWAYVRHQHGEPLEGVHHARLGPHRCTIVGRPISG